MILTTPRCSLRPFTREDAEHLVPILGSDNVMRYSMTGPMDLSAIHTTLDSWITLYNQRGFSPWAVMHDDMLIGYAGLDIRVVEGIEQVQVTFRLAESHWRQGFATELALAILDYAFTELGLPEVIAIVDPENQASIRTISKIGMQFNREVVYGGLLLHVYNIMNNNEITPINSAALASQNFFFRSMSVTLFEHEGILASSMGIDNPFLNLVLHTELNEKTLTTTIRKVEDFFESQHVPWSWLIFPFSKPKKLADILEKQGMVEREIFAIMGRDMMQPLQKLSVPSFSIHEVQAAKDFDDWSIPLREGFDSTTETTLQFRKLTERIPYGEGNNFHHYTLYKGNNPIAVGTLSLHQGNARLDNIAVCTNHQRKGFGTAITQHMLTEAKRLGAKHCFLDASHQGIGLYKNLGFREYYTGWLYGKAVDN